MNKVTTNEVVNEVKVSEMKEGTLFYSESSLGSFFMKTDEEKVLNLKTGMLFFAERRHDEEYPNPQILQKVMIERDYD